MNYKTTSPIVLFIYKRPQLTESVLAQIRLVKPSQLFVIADGPKSVSEQEICQQTRDIIKQVDWSCEVKTNFAKNNMGLRNRVVSGLDWVFSQVDRAIILEDDCLPNQDFFKYCDQLLIRYQDDKRITTISGNNFLFGKHKTEDSYYFSRYPLIWGWATWKRVWDQYDPTINSWKKRRDTSWLRDLLQDKTISLYWKYIFNRVLAGKINTWDYQLTYLSFGMGGYNIHPSKNLVSNLGLDASSTHINEKNKNINMPTKALDFPLRHPSIVTTDHKREKAIAEQCYLSWIACVSLTIKSAIGLI